MATERVREEQTEKTQKIKKKERKQRKNIRRLCMYAAASLSFISFLTTAEGMVAVIGEEDSWKACFISFGIQAIVLILGTRFFEVWKIIKETKEGKTEPLKIVKKEGVFGRFVNWLNKWLRFGLVNLFVRMLMIALYASAIAFSSFFSFVFLANHAYKDVRYSDYNIKIERFLVEETRNLRDTNDAVGRLMLAEIQNSVPEFQELIDELHKTSIEDLRKIIDDAMLQKNWTDTIPEENRYHAQAVIDRFEPDDAQIQTIMEYEGRLNGIVGAYEQSYKSYNYLFGELNNLPDPNLAGQRSDRIDREIKTLENYVRFLDGMSDSLSWIRISLQNATNAMKTDLESLIKSFNDLKSVYDQIKTDDLVEGVNIDLQKIYEVIYSSENVSEEDVVGALSDLKAIIAEYLEKTDEIDNNVAQGISSCVVYLSEFQKYLELKNSITVFEDNVLNQVYLIKVDKKETCSDETTDSEQESPPDTTASELRPHTTVDSEGNILYNEVTSEQWRQLRREDMAQYIRLLKTLPDVKLLIQTMEKKSGSEANAEELQGYNDYVNDTLLEAYEINRSTLEEINEVEGAWEFLQSEYRFMAVFCGLIAFFMDFASFLIGIILFYDKRSESKPKVPSA